MARFYELETSLYHTMEHRDKPYLYCMFTRDVIRMQNISIFDKVCCTLEFMGSLEP